MPVKNSAIPAINISGGKPMTQAEYYKKLNEYNASKAATSSIPSVVSKPPEVTNTAGAVVRPGMGPVIAAAAVPGLQAVLEKSGVSTPSTVSTDLKTPIATVAAKKVTVPNATGSTGSGAAGSAWQAGENSFLKQSSAGIPNTALIAAGLIALFFFFRKR
jgi:hypothetical protein